MRLKDAQFFYLVSKGIKPKASRLFKLIKCLKKHPNLVVVAVMKEFGVLNIDLFLKLRIEKSYYCITLV